MPLSINGVLQFICDPDATAQKFTNAFWAHMFYMSLSFGLFAPIGAVAS